MSDEPTKGVPNIDNLTPFEYALAGVTIPDGHDSPSLAVIKEMRQLAGEVEDAAITHGGLREFLQSGGPMAKRSDRRSMRSRKASRPLGTSRDRTEGGFIDITPIELVEDASPGAATNGQPTVAGSTGGGPVVNEFEDTVPPVAADELQALGLLATNGANEDLGAPQASVFEPPEIETAASNEPEFDQPRFGLPIPEATTELETGEPEFDETGTPVSDSTPPKHTGPEAEPAPSVDEAAAFHLTRIEPPRSDTAPLVLDDGSELPPVPERPPVRIRRAAEQDAPLFPEVEDDPDFKVVGGPAEPDAGSLAAASPLFADVDPDGEDDGAVLIPATGAGVAGILEPTDDESDQGAAVPAAAMAGSVPIQKRRLGSGAVWALGGTMVASAALAVGALWWAGGIGDRTETESAATELTSTTAADVVSGSDVEDEAGGSSATLDMSSDEAGDPDGPGAEDNTGRSTTAATSTAGEDGTGTTEAPQSTTIDPAKTPGTNPSGDQTNQTSVPSADVTSQTTPVTTNPPTTEGPTTDPTERPTTEVPTTEAPAVTPPEPVNSPGFIGDSVNIGSYGGAPASGALVGLFDDPDGDGESTSRIRTQFTDANGRYAFNVPAGCYVVRFYPLDGFRVDPDLELQPVCVSAGGSAPRIDAILYPLQASAPPSGCHVEPLDYGEVAGVEVYENNRDWADSYTFYNRDGGVVTRTADMGPPHDIDNPNDYEWEADEGGFNLRSVWRVAAERNGVLSDQITCSR